MQTERAVQLYEEKYGKRPEWVAQAPGRINLIGEHTDYSDGFVMPIALEWGVSIAAGPSDDGLCHWHSDSEGPGEPFAPGEMPRGWARYPAAMARVLGHDFPAINAVVTSDLPTGAGVSSSAAIEVASGLIWLASIDKAMTASDLARAAQRAENQEIGVACGLMDQAASALGRAGHALLMDMGDFAVTPVPIPPEAAIIMLDTGTRRGLVDSAYNERRQQVEAAAAAMGVAKLRHAILPQLASAPVDEVTRRRAHHVITENHRVQQFAEALKSADLEFAGQLMRESHVSLRDDFAVSGPELDAMAEIANAHPACYGARLTGAGFAGACVSLVREPLAQGIVNSVKDGFSDRFSELTPSIRRCEAGVGARLVSPF